LGAGGSLMSASAAPVDARAAEASLRSAHAAASDRLQRSPFGRPLHLASSEAEDELRGEVLAVIEQPFAVVGDTLRSPEAWCDILILHPNVRQCRASAAPEARLAVHLGRAEHEMDFAYDVRASSATYLRVGLDSPTGPMGTSDYRIVLETAPLEGGRSIVRFSYAHGYGTSARLALQAYLGTLGRGKVGFTATGRDPEGQPAYVSGVRGALERNTMRYYLAIEAHLAARTAPPRERGERALQHWLAAAGRHPKQLAEEADYVERKRADLRQHAAARPAATPAQQGAAGARR
jgi:hypothetical protein